MSQLNIPVYKIVEEAPTQGNSYWIIDAEEHQLVPQPHREEFKKSKLTYHHQGKLKTTYLTLCKARQTTIEGNAYVQVSQAGSKCSHFLGCFTDFLTSAYKFDRKSTKKNASTISIHKGVSQVDRAISLSNSRNRAREWANGRGDIQGNPQTFRKIAQQFGKQHNLQVTVFSGEQLLKEGFRLMHAVGRGSKNDPVFVNLAYKGNPNSEQWVSYVGKGVCFDTGGYNIKPTSGIGNMFLDKHGAMSVLSAFQTIVLDKVAINLTCSIGLVQNFVSSNAYRPSDIITSRKGLTVEIGNTDAEGRLVLADCMNWVQQKFKPKVLIELSTLTGAMIVALGSEMSGVFTNCKQLFKQLNAAGTNVNQLVWRMPVTQYHKKIITPKHCDLTNSAGKTQAGAGQAAAFLQSFVEEGVRWAHIDIAGTAIQGFSAGGWGSRILVEYAHRFVQQK